MASCMSFFFFNFCKIFVFVCLFLFTENHFYQWMHTETNKRNQCNVFLRTLIWCCKILLVHSSIIIECFLNTFVNKCPLSDIITYFFLLALSLIVFTTHLADFLTSSLFSFVSNWHCSFQSFKTSCRPSLPCILLPNMDNLLIEQTTTLDLNILIKVDD